MNKTKNPLFHQKPTDNAKGALTPKQKNLLDFILQFTEENGYSPSQQEIAHHFGFSSLGTVQNYLVRLQQNGFLQRDWNGKRSLRAVEISPKTSSETSTARPPKGELYDLPLLGRVAAGKPLEAITTGETLQIPPSMKKPGELFALQVQGTSMIEDGILNGDYVIIRKQASAQNGQTVVAMVNNEATIKRFFKNKTGVELHPANSALKPILVDPGENFRIEGVLVGVLRHF